MQEGRVCDPYKCIAEQVGHDVDIKPAPQPVTDNDLVTSTANTNDDARLHVSARGFWITGQKALASGCSTLTHLDTKLEVLSSVLQ